MFASSLPKRRMASENNRDRENMGLFVPRRSEEIDRLLAETRERLENSRRFLESMSGSEARTRDYLHELVTSLEKKIDRLTRDQLQGDPDEQRS